MLSSVNRVKCWDGLVMSATGTEQEVVGLSQTDVLALVYGAVQRPFLGLWEPMRGIWALQSARGVET